MVCAKTIFAWNRNAKRKTEYPNVPTKVASRARRYTPPCFACWGRLPNPHKTPPFGGGCASLRTLPRGAFAPQVARAKTASRVKMNGLRPPLTRPPARAVLQPRRESLIRLFLRQKPPAGRRKGTRYLSCSCFRSGCSRASPRSLSMFIFAVSNSFISLRAAAYPT